MELYKSGESIEAQHAKVFGKKILAHGMIKHDTLGQLRRYTIERDGAASIEKELNPKKAIYKQTSRIDLGDALQCVKFFMLAKELSLKFKKTAFSGAHNTQLTLTQDFTYAEISHPFLHIVNAIERRKQAATLLARN